MKIDVDRQVAYWRKGAEEDWEVGAELVATRKTRHGLFFIHLAIEKLLKAHVCRATKEFAPKIHSLIRLSELSGLDVSTDRRDFLANFTRFNLAGRYPETLGSPPSPAEARLRLSRAREVYEWLQSLL